MPTNPIDRRIYGIALTRTLPALALAAALVSLPLPALLSGAAVSFLSFYMISRSVDGLLSRARSPQEAPPSPRNVGRLVASGNALRLAATGGLALLCARLSPAHLVACLLGLSAIPFTLVAAGAAGRLSADGPAPSGA